MVVADTSPLNYLILINQNHLLPELYGPIIIPASVLDELRVPETPEPVRTWANSLPDWIEVKTAARSADAGLSRLHAGERDAISLALELSVDAVLIDERRGRDEAEKRGLRVIGTLGVLASAHERGLVNLVAAVDALRQTSFHINPKLLASVLLKYRDRRE